MSDEPVLIPGEVNWIVRSNIERKQNLSANDISKKMDGFGIGEAGRVSESTALDEIEAERLQPTIPQPIKLVRCDCGHTVPSSWVMSASLGSSCENCYDRMSG